jgi:ACR3 family arsenite transporter
MKTLNLFERYLTLWVALCMGAGILMGKMFPDAVNVIRSMEFGKGSQINIPIAILIWLMIYPMMLKVDFSSILNVGRRPKGLLVTLFVNWVVKPFSMAFIGWLFFQHIFFSWIGPELADQYVAGVIILAAAPCTAMVFVWSYLTGGDPAYTLVQVSVNDLIMLVLFAPIVTFLVSVLFYCHSARSGCCLPDYSHSREGTGMVRSLRGGSSPDHSIGAACHVGLHFRLPGG